MKLCSVRNGSSVSTAVNERGEGTVVAVRAAYLCRSTSFQFNVVLLLVHSTHSEKGLVKSTTDFQLSIISSHQTIFISIKYDVVDFIKVP